MFLNSWRVSCHIVRYDTNPPAMQKQQWHSREAQIEPPFIECECEWAFRIRAYICVVYSSIASIIVRKICWAVIIIGIFIGIYSQYLYIGSKILYYTVLYCTVLYCINTKQSKLPAQFSRHIYLAIIRQCRHSNNNKLVTSSLQHTSIIAPIAVSPASI
jgi:hypothetical protein